MTTLVVDATLQDQLKRLTELTLLTDEKGTPLGHFVPGAKIDSNLYRLAEGQCPYSARQLQQIRLEMGGKSLAQIWLAVSQR